MEFRDMIEVIAEMKTGIRPNKMMMGICMPRYHNVLPDIQPPAMMRVKAGTRDHTVILRKARSCGTKDAIASIEISRVNREVDKMCSY